LNNCRESSFIIKKVYLYKTRLLFLVRLKVRDSIVSVGPTLSKSKKVNQYIRRNTHKPIPLRCLAGGGAILYVGLA